MLDTLPSTGPYGSRARNGSCADRGNEDLGLCVAGHIRIVGLAPPEAEGLGRETVAVTPGSSGLSDSCA